MTVTKKYYYNTSVKYKDKTYPANAEEVIDDNGNIVTKNVFADANGGRHFINDDGTLTGVYPNNGELPEVVVTAPLTYKAVKQQYANDRRLQFFQGKPDVFGWLKFENDLNIKYCIGRL